VFIRCEKCHKQNGRQLATFYSRVLAFELNLAKLLINQDANFQNTAVHLAHLLVNHSAKCQNGAVKET